jgi:hypothetical protein
MRHLGPNGVRLGLVVSFYLLGGYLVTFPHKGSNSSLSSMFNTDLYQATRGQFVSEFQVLNRNFTELEVDQFLNNEDLKRLGKRKYTYNPLVWDNETQYKLVYERLNSGVHDLIPSEVNDIEKNNSQKSQAGEDVMLKPSLVNDMIDATGLKLRRRGAYSFIGKSGVLD